MIQKHTTNLLQKMHPDKLLSLSKDNRKNHFQNINLSICGTPDFLFSCQLKDRQ